MVLVKTKILHSPREILFGTSDQNLLLTRLKLTYALIVAHFYISVLTSVSSSNLTSEISKIIDSTSFEYTFLKTSKKRVSQFIPLSLWVFVQFEVVNYGVQKF